MRAAVRGLLLCGLLVSGGSGRAQPPDATCHDYGSLSDGAAIRLGRVKADARRTNFVKGSDENYKCPAAVAACRAKAFVVPGNMVILGAERGGYVCADYVGATGQERVGWLPTETIAPEIGAPPLVAEWAGTWIREEARIVVKPAPKAGAIVVTGDATYGAKDPDRVKRGGVNIGAIEGTMAPTGGDASFAMGQDKAGNSETSAVDKGGQYDCKVWMKRLGPWLLVDDNNNCGGFNVTFRGTYVRGK